MTDAAKTPAKEATPVATKVELKSYKCLNPIEHDGKSYNTGATIKLDNATAISLLRLGAIVDPEAMDKAED
jgi:hypothetical protein